jgi:hypothetical protein
MYVTNADKILFAIRGGIYHLRGLKSAVKIIKSMFKNM